VQDGRTYIELINAPSLYQFKGRLPRCLIDAADRGCIRMLAEIARAARTTALRIVYSTQLMVGRDSHLPPRCVACQSAESGSATGRRTTSCNGDMVLPRPRPTPGR
jgi:hypothetical protein